MISSKSCCVLNSVPASLITPANLYGASPGRKTGAFNWFASKMHPLTIFTVDFYCGRLNAGSPLKSAFTILLAQSDCLLKAFWLSIVVFSCYTDFFSSKIACLFSLVVCYSRVACWRAASLSNNVSRTSCLADSLSVNLSTNILILSLWYFASSRSFLSHSRRSRSISIYVRMASYFNSYSVGCLVGSNGGGIRASYSRYSRILYITAIVPSCAGSKPFYIVNSIKSLISWFSGMSDAGFIGADQGSVCTSVSR